MQRSPRFLPWLARIGARVALATPAVGQLLLAACAERAVAPIVPTEEPTVTAVQGFALRDVADRVAPSLADRALAIALSHAVVQLRTQMEAGQFSDAVVSLASTRNLVRAARAADDGAMDADLSVVELALDDALGSLRAASLMSPGRVPY